MDNYPAYHPEKRTGLRLDPRTKILFMVLVTLLLFFAYENTAIALTLSVIPMLFLLVSRQRKTALIFGGLFILGIFVDYLKNTLPLAPVLNSVFVCFSALILRFFPTIVLGYYIVESTKISEFITAMERWHVPQSFIIPITVMFRFIPTLSEESMAITDAMRMREIQFGTRKFRKDPGALLEYRIVPLLVSVVKIGEELSAAALTRGLGNPVKRTSIAEIGFGFYDFIVLAASVALLLWVFIW